MDPLSISASIGALLTTTGAVLGYINSLKNAPRERNEIGLELASILGLLTSLRYRVEASESSDPWFQSARSLGAKSGPLEQFQDALERVAKKIRVGQRGVGAIKATVLWHFNKDDVMELLGKIERLKLLTNLAMTDDLSTLTLAVKEDVASMRRDVHRTADCVQDLLIEVKSSRDADEIQAICDWLSPLDFTQRRHEALAARKEGTCHWIFENTIFTQWRDSAMAATLWLPGIPGAGKTVISATVFEHLQDLHRRESDVTVLYIRCEYTQRSTQSEDHLVGSVLKQLIETKHALADTVIDMRQDLEKKGKIKTTSQIQNAIAGALKSYKKVYLVIDALDEAVGDGPALVARLRQVQEQMGRLYIVATSRETAEVKGCMEKAAELRIEAKVMDVELYVTSCIRQDRKWARQIQDDFLSEVVSKITEKADGMFLLVKLHLDSILHSTSIRAVKNKLDTLPTRIKETYDNAMQRIDDQYEEERELAYRVLAWVVFGLRIMTIQEIQHAVATEFGATDFDMLAVADTDLLLSTCAGLITMEETTEVRLIHYTTQDFLKVYLKEHDPNIDKTLARTCITYLSSESMLRRSCTNMSATAFHQLSKDYLFFSYALTHWGEHVRGVVDGPTDSIVIRFLSTPAVIQSLGHLGAVSTNPIDPDAWIPAAPSVLSIADSGFDGKIPGASQDATEENTRPQAPIISIELTEADRDTADHNGGPNKQELSLESEDSPQSSEASKPDDEGIASANSDNADDLWTGLDYAAFHGLTSIIAALITTDNLNTAKKSGTTPLRLALRRGFQETAQVLIDHGADVEGKPGSLLCENLIQDTFKDISISLIKFLLKNGADPNLKRLGHRLYPIEYAVVTMSEEATRLLLTHGANPHAGGEGPYASNRFPIVVAGCGYSVSWPILKLLVQHDEAPLEKRFVYDAVLTSAICKANLEIVQLMLDKGADPNAVGGISSNGLYGIHPGSPPDCAFSERENMARYTGLQIAVYMKEVEIVKTLLKHGANPNAEPSAQTMHPLSMAARIEVVEGAAIIRLLLDHGADVNARSIIKWRSARSPLEVAAVRGDAKVVSLLLKEGALADSVGEGEKGAAQLAREDGFEDVAQILEAGSIA